MIWFWMIWSVVGLVISVAVHLSTYLGVNPQADIPGVWVLHVAMFPPFFAAGLYAMRVAGEGIEQVMKAAPNWLRVMAGVFFAYAVINFLLFVLLAQGSPAQENGQYYLHERGTHIRDLSKDEFHQHQARAVRGFSGHWMLFYMAACLLMVGAEGVRNAGRLDEPDQ